MSDFYTMLYAKRLQTAFSLSSLPQRGRVGVGDEIAIETACSIITYISHWTSMN